jgi:type IV pilus assembly protein PilW
MSRLLKTSGFTMIELMISVAIFSIVTLAAFAVLSSGHQLSVTMDQTVQVQQNVRMALDLIARDVRMTGYGNPTAGALAGCAQHMNAVDNNPAGVDAGADSISIMTMDQQIGTLNAPYINGSTITLGSALPSDIVVGDVVSIDGVFTGSVAAFNAGARTITLSQTGTVTPLVIIPPVNFQPGAPVVRLACVTYSVTDGLGQIGGINVLNPPMPFQLIRTVNGGIPVAMVDGIESLQLAYGIDANGDGIIDDQNANNIVDCIDFVPNNTPCAQGGVVLPAGGVVAPPASVNTTPTTARLARITVVGRAVPPSNANVVGSTWSDPTYTGNSSIQAEDQVLAATPGIRRRALSRVVNLRDASIL